MTIYKTLKGKQASLEENHFGKGGEGKIYKIIASSDFPNHCVKIFVDKRVITKTKKELENRDYRIKYMILNQPSQIETDKIRICWPIDAIFENNHIIGFIMPLAFPNSVQLYSLCQPKLKQNLSSDWHNTYDRSMKTGVLSRLKLCTNISIAINSVHKITDYVFVDLKPPNILVSLDGKISLIDCDSIQISENDKIFFYGSVATEEYIPPEGKNIDTKSTPIKQSWDLFSLAVIFYQILFGLHPYSVSFKDMNETNNSFQYRIRNSLFAHGENKDKISVIPDLHYHYKLLPKYLINLFEKAFENLKFGETGRPDTEDWGRAFYESVQNDTWIGNGFSKYQTKPPIHPFTIPTGKSRTDISSSPPKAKIHWWKALLAYFIWFVLCIILILQCNS
ncbi:hypothetical protein GCM10011344_42780 [Dokdonia pacifica]|uniref:Protein kinase domain-containing protein n=1 Tax=Dokdonia pacifica TaxID=1627892 RepID=A0A239AHJ0_9FLAO|nr:hypothetical protein [Dokdonia pacifica]GGG37399.1 hypothetical protein GCM10011344_42780 [Dokdonia pacifica]SNR95107.1 Protein kinase domain-containing protein [Dokdonia pacifica]